MSASTSKNTVAKGFSAQPVGEEQVPGSSAGDDGMITKPVLAARMDVSIRCVENWQQAKLVPFIKVGRVVRFHWPSVVAHLLAHSSSSAEGSPLVDAQLLGLACACGRPLFPTAPVAAKPTAKPAGTQVLADGHLPNKTPNKTKGTTL